MHEDGHSFCFWTDYEGQGHHSLFAFPLIADGKVTIPSFFFSLFFFFLHGKGQYIFCNFAKLFRLGHHLSAVLQGRLSFYCFTVLAWRANCLGKISTFCCFTSCVWCKVTTFLGVVGMGVGRGELFD